MNLIENTGTTIHIFSRNGKQRLHQIIEDFKPYFFILSKDVELTDNFFQITKVIPEQVPTIDGQQVAKVFVSHPSEVPKIRDQFFQTYEADVVYTQRYTIDRYRNEIPKEDLRVCYLDIETNSHEDFPNVETANHEITCVSCFDNLLDTMFTFVWHPIFQKQTFESKLEDKKWVISKHDNEKDFLSDFGNFIKVTDPDLLTGWNIEKFDIKYIINRFKNVNMFPDILSPLNQVWLKENIDKQLVPQIKGRIIFDMWEAYRKMSYGDLPSYRLQYIANEVEKIGSKTEFVGSHSELWKNNVEKLIEYNATDTLLVYKINKKKQIIEYNDEIRRISKCSFNDVMENSKIVDSFLLSFCKDKVILPTKPKYDQQHHHISIKGAQVLTPVSGMHRNVGVCDLNALYPSIIISGNMSPETLSTIPIPNAVKVDIIRDGVPISCYFNQEKKGILPQILSYIFNKRKEVQKLRDTYEVGSEQYNYLEAKQYAYKILSNSHYGVLSYPRFRLYRAEIGEAITTVGRQIILWSKDIVEKQGYKVVYGDTDSLLNILNNIEEGYKIEKMLNQSYIDFAKKFNMSKPQFNTSFEKFYNTIVFGESKKRYAGWQTYYKGKQVDKVDIVGFESNRSDSSQLGRQVQREVFKRLLKDQQTKKEILRYILDVKQRIRDRKFKYIEIGCPTPLTRKLEDYKVNTPVVRAVKYSNKYFNMNIRVGEKFYLLYVLHLKGLPTTDVIAFRNEEDIPEGVTLDINSHIEEAITSKTERIFEALGWSSAEIKGQYTLDSFC